MEGRGGRGASVELSHKSVGREALITPSICGTARGRRIGSHFYQADWEGGGVGRTLFLFFLKKVVMICLKLCSYNI